MEKILLGTSDLAVSRIGLGCMRYADKTVDEVAEIIQTALAAGINFFDHADIYAGGKSEVLFGQALKQLGINREDIIIQSKCAIRPDKKTYDFSKEHILTSVDGILERLQVEYLDVLLLHRPDTLFEGQEVAEAFDILEASGKVRHFGVSNQNPMQLDLLQKYVQQPLIVNQVQFSIMHTGIVDTGLYANTPFDQAIFRNGGILEHARLKDITIQTWSPFMYGYFEGVFIDNPKFPELKAVIDRLAASYNVSTGAIAIAWILRHPAKMQPIIGTTNTERLTQITEAVNVTLTREEWYEIYVAAGNALI